MTELDNIRYFAVSDIGLRRKRNEFEFQKFYGSGTQLVGYNCL